MKANVIAALEGKASCAGRAESRSQLTVLLLAFVVLAVGGCEYLNPEPNYLWKPVGHQYYAGGPDLAVRLGGYWYHNDRPASISVEPDGRHLSLTNEFGQRSSGYVDGNREIIISSLGARGHVGYGELYITWSNGTVWTREWHGVPPLVMSLTP
jgi:hypothetical protein